MIKALKVVKWLLGSLIILLGVIGVVVYFYVRKALIEGSFRGFLHTLAEWGALPFLLIPPVLSIWLGVASVVNTVKETKQATQAKQLPDGEPHRGGKKRGDGNKKGTEKTSGAGAALLARALPYLIGLSIGLGWRSENGVWVILGCVGIPAVLVGVMIYLRNVAESRGQPPW